MNSFRCPLRHSRPAVGLRVVAALLIPVQVFASVPVPLLAAVVTAPAEAPSAAPARALQPPASALAKPARTVAHPPQVPTFSKPDSIFHAEASDDRAIVTARLFEEPLVPQTAEDTVGENAGLARALALYSQAPQDLAPLLGFLAAHPDSRWKASLQTNLGLIHFRRGEWSEALACWEDSWSRTKDDTQPRIKTLADRTLGELSQLHARLGHFDRLESLFQETNGRDVRGAGTERVAGARQGLWLMKNDPGEAFRCGPMAVSRLFQLVYPGEAVPAVIGDLKSTQQGTDLSTLRELARKVGLDCQVAFRSPGAAVLVPSVIHWKVGHYAALSGQGEDQYLSQDPTFGTDTMVSAATLDREASGYFLVRGGALPPGWRPVQADEAAREFGKGNAGPYASASPPRYAVTGHGSPVPGGQGGNPNGAGGSVGSPCGMATYDLELASASLMLADIPVGYAPPVGPEIQFIANYNHREAAAMTNISNLGSKWSFGWLTYVQAPSTSATVSYGPGGGQVSYSGYNSGTGAFAPQIQSQDRLVRVSSTNYVQYHLDGSRDVYDLAEGGSNPRIFRTSFVDRFGHTIAYGYDSDYRLRTVTDAIGQVTVLDYGRSTNPADPAYFNITKVTDPFGRYAEFQYNGAGQLISITDVLGLVSQFSYGTGDFITGLTTPYGITAFAGSDLYSGPTNYNRWLEATDPLGGKERVEWVRDSTGVIASSDSASLVPAGFSNTFLQFRNSFYWDKKAMLVGPGDYTKARLTHWLHITTSDSTLGSNVVESTKNPLENRVWYAYPGQSSTLYLGTSNLPSKVARILDDSTEQDYTYQYNTAGNVTQAVDPLGRETDYVYDTNLTDLLQIKQKRGATFDVVTAFTYSTQHLPLTVTDAAGQVTTNTYNSSGEILTVTNPKSQVVTYAYDTNGYLQTITGPVSGATTTFTYDTFGRPDTVTDSEGYTVTTDYDAFDRPTQVTFPDGSYQQMIYNRLDLEWSRDRLGQWSREMHDALRHLVLVQDPLSRRTTYEWCTCGALTGLTDPAGHRTTWTRDLQSRVTQKTYPDSTSVSYVYENTTSRLKSSTDARSQVTNYQYFKDNQPSQVSYTSAVIATPTVSYTYDTVYPRQATMTDGSGTTTYTYNTITTTPTLGAGRLASVDGPLANDTIAYTYDELGRVLSRSINSTANASSVTYDTLGRTATATNPLGTFTYAYLNQTSRLSSLTYPSGQVANYTYYPNSAGTPGNDDQRLEQIENLRPDTSNLSTFGYTYDANGRIQTWSRQIDAASPLTSSFTYDAASQLIGAKVPSTSATVDYAYGYDAAGNRTEEQIDAGVTTSTHNSANQLTGQSPGGSMQFTGTVNEPAAVTLNGVPAAVDATGAWIGRTTVSTGGNTIPVVATDLNSNVTNKTISITVAGGSTRTLTYDSNGNLTNNGAGQTYDWDAADRLVKITQGTDVTEFVYDGLGRRVQEKFNTTLIRQWVWADGAQPAEERNASNVVTKRFYGQGEQIGGTAYFFTMDHLGSIREMTDASGVVQARYEYDPYGRRTKLSGSLDADFGYTGFFYHSGTGLSLALYRAYDADLGRWLARDPSGESSGVNLYGYVENNPVNFTDPLGLKYAELWAGYGAVGGGGLAVVGSIPADVITGGANIIVTPEEVALGATVGGAIGYSIGKVVDWVSGGSAYATIAVHNTGSSSDGKVKAKDVGLPEISPDTGIPKGWIADPANPGKYINPNGRGTAAPDLKHPAPIGPHTDIWPGNGEGWRVFPDGTAQPKNNSAKKKADECTSKN